MEGYKIISANSVTGLEEKVNQARENGYLLAGGLCVISDRYNQLGYITYLQAVYLVEWSK